MVFKNDLSYAVVAFGIYFILNNEDKDEIIKSQSLLRIARTINEDEGILEAFEEGKLNLNDLNPDDSEELKGLINSIKFSNNYIEIDE